MLCAMDICSPLVAVEVSDNPKPLTLNPEARIPYGVLFRNALLESPFARQQWSVTDTVGGFTPRHDPGDQARVWVRFVCKRRPTATTGALSLKVSKGCRTMTFCWFRV